MSKKTPPKVEDINVQKAVDKIYDEINALSKAVNKESTYDSRTEGEGKSGDTRVFYDTSSDKYYIEGRTQGGWGKTRLYLKGDALEYVTGGGAVDWSADQGGSPVINAGNYTSYTNSEAVTAMGAEADSNALNHTKYTNTNSVSAMGTKGDSNALNHDKYNLSVLKQGTGVGDIVKDLTTETLNYKSIKAASPITVTNNTDDITIGGGGLTTVSNSDWNTSSDLAVANGGTGASNQGDARNNLGVDPIGTDNSTNVTLAGTPDYITISGQVITRGAIVLTTDVSGSLPDANIASASTWNGMLDSALGNGGASSVSLVKTANDGGTAQLRNIKAGGSITIAIDGTDDHINIGGGGLTTVALGSNVTGTLPVANGGTNSANASDARDALGVDPLGTDNSTNVTLSGTPDYLTISGQVITRGAIVLTTDVSGNLPDGNIASASTWNAMIDSCLGNGGVGAVSVVKTSNDSGTIQLRNIKGTGSITVAVDGTDDHINIGGGGLTSVNNGDWSGTALALGNGGTGATDAAGARTALVLGNSAQKDVGTGSTNVSAGNHSHSYVTSAVAGNGISVSSATGAVTITNTSPDVDHFHWDGSDTGLNDVTGRASLGLGTAAQSATGDFAASAHNHSAGNITSGTLAEGRGGTGVTTYALLKTALSLGSAADADLGTGSGDAAIGNHNHSGVYQPTGSYLTLSGTTSDGIMTYGSGTTLHTESNLTYGSGVLHVNKAGASDGKIYISADEGNINEAYNPFLIFIQDGNLEESAVYMDSNQLIIANGVTSAGGISIRTGSSDNSYTIASERMEFLSDGNITPGANGTQDFGSTGKRWENIWATGVKATTFYGGSSLTSGLTATKTFTVANGDVHSVEINGGIITLWSVLE